jgi:hypothetical protein
MEMRRRANRKDLFLWMYDAASRYGTDWRRPLILLACLVGLAAVLMHWRGFVTPQGWWHALVFSLGSTLYIAHPPGKGLRVGGELVQFVLRIGGPLFIGLTLFALRSRVNGEPSSPQLR